MKPVHVETLAIRIEAIERNARWPRTELARLRNSLCRDLIAAAQDDKAGIGTAILMVADAIDRHPA